MRDPFLVIRNIWWKCVVLVSLRTPLRGIPRRGYLSPRLGKWILDFGFLHVASIRNVTPQKDRPELQESAIPNPKTCHDLGWNQKPEAKQKKIANGWWHKIQKHHILDAKTENQIPKVAISIKLKFPIAQWSVPIAHS